MPRRELRWRYSPDRAVRPRLVVIASPLGYHGPSVRKSVEVVIVQALVPKLAVEALLSETDFTNFQVVASNGSRSEEQKSLTSTIVVPLLFDLNQGTCAEYFVQV